MIGTKEEIENWLLNQDEEKQFEIKEHKQKRSLNANSYCWVLLGKIAHVIGSTKEEVYKEYITHKGIYRVITIDEAAADTFIKVWQEKGLGWVCEKSTGQREGFIEVVAYYGTSTYNTKQMTHFIDYVVEEAKHLDIETLPPSELARLKDLWK